MKQTKCLKAYVVPWTSSGPRAGHWGYKVFLFQQDAEEETDKDYRQAKLIEGLVFVYLGPTYPLQYSLVPFSQLPLETQEQLLTPGTPYAWTPGDWKPSLQIQYTTITEQITPKATA